MSFEYSEANERWMKKIAEFHLSEHYEKQFIQAIQELAELQFEITKWQLGKGNFEELIEEVFDADFMIYQLKLSLLTKEEDIEKWKFIVDTKLLSELRRHDLK